MTPPRVWFDEIGDLTALRCDDSGRFYRANYQRGPLLYSLVARYRPSLILELGTGRGYGTVCMARALVDHDIDGRIVTADRIPPDTPQDWAIDDGSGPGIAQLTLADMARVHFDSAWRERITHLTGTTADVLSSWRQSGLPAPEFGFIDAGHRYEEVRHDFYSFLSIVSAEFAVLLDDYVERTHFGVKQLVDSELMDAFRPQLIRTSWDSVGEIPVESDTSGMVLIDSRQRSSWSEALPPGEIQNRLKDARTRLSVLAVIDRLKSPFRFALRLMRVRR